MNTSGGDIRTAHVVTISTGCAAGHRDDRSGRLAGERLTELGLAVDGYTIIPDDRLKIAQTILRHCDFEPVSLLFLTGGTGPTPNDVTPAALLGLLDRRFEGLEHAIHTDGRRATVHAPLSRIVVGMRGQTIIVAAPGSPGGVTDTLRTLAPLLPHLLALAHGEDDPHT